MNCQRCDGMGFISAWCPTCEVRFEPDELIQVQPDGHFACEMCDPDTDPDKLERTECPDCIATERFLPTLG